MPMIVSEVWSFMGWRHFIEGSFVVLAQSLHLLQSAWRKGSSNKKNSKRWVLFTKGEVAYIESRLIEKMKVSK